MGEILSICVKTRGRIEGGKTPVVHVLLCRRVYVCVCGKEDYRKGT